MTQRQEERTPAFVSVMEAFQRHVSARPDDQIFHYLQDQEDSVLSLSLGELDQAARGIAAALRGQVSPGQRALLLFPPDLDFIKAFCGCLYSGVVAVPTYPPNPARLNRTLPRFLAIANDANPQIVLTTSEIMAMSEALTAFAPAFKEIRWLAIDELTPSPDDAADIAQVQAGDSALIQYTSGSTGEPSGVVVTHGNVIHNQEIIRQAFGHTEDLVGVNWLPLYHDMGLIGNVLQPMYLGRTTVIMSPISFLKRPRRWFEAITRFGGTTSGGPNFAYEMCVRKIGDDQLEGLDLSTWDLAYNGAEPIRTESMERFAKKFAKCGFRAEAFYPCYGLAEGTLMIAGGEKMAPYRVINIDTEALERDNAASPAEESKRGRTLVSSGKPWLGLDLRIVDTQSLAEQPTGTVGEIWVRGESVARGYWNQQEKTEQIFGARLAGSGEGPFLRTGDLGFLDDHGELFVTGRSKDLIIIHGRNHYPHDLELTAEASNPAALRPGCSAAFSIEVEGSERLVIVQELERRTQQDRQAAPDRRAPHPEIDATVPKLNAPLDPAQVVQGIQHAVSEAHDIGVYSLVLVKAGTILKTSSGKIQRGACRQAYLDGTLEIVSEWREPKAAPSDDPVTDESTPAAQQRAVKRSTRDIEDWLRAQLAHRLKLDARNVERRRPFWSYGLDSKETLNLLGDLERWLDRQLPDTLLWDYPSIGSLSRHLTGAPLSSKPASERTLRTHAADEPIAIIGMSCRLPGASDLEQLWSLLREGGDAVSELPAERLGIDPAWGALGDKGAAARRGGFLDHIDAFDPAFFDISAREAARMDPQQRVLLEVAWEAFEDAGLPVERLAGGSAGVFIGISGFDYARLARSVAPGVDLHDGTGNALSVAANRISYQFDLQGPSLAVDTACSSSLYAVHLACQSLLSGEADVALAGGVNVILTPDLTLNFTKAGVLSPDGRCKAFDGRADGYVRSEGAGLVLLKPLADALADGDRVYAVIRGSAVNNDGLSNGLIAPNGLAQERVLREAYRRAHVEPGKVQYVETYGTGTIVGDPIEARALGNVMREDRPPDRPCAIGSLKTNLGHLEAASGIAGLIKVALSLERGEIPPSINFERPSPHIPFVELGLEVQRALGSWRDDPNPPLAGVSSFGFGGTNVHVVLEGAPTALQADETEELAGDTRLLPISARSYPALLELAQRYHDALASDESPGSIDHLCHAAALRRAHHDHRVATTGSTSAELADGLQRILEQERREPHSAVPRSPAQQPQLAFVFSGLGSECWPIGRDLLRNEPVFRQSIETCDRMLLRHVPWSLTEELKREQASSRLVQTDIAQPALFSVQISLVALWRSWGITPSVIVGHSAGEVAAAYVAGALSLEDAIRVIAQRGRVMRLREGLGSMVEVELGGDQVLDLLAKHEGRLTLAAHNGPAAAVLAGEPALIQEITTELEAQGTTCRPLRSTIAQQSAQMEGPAATLVHTLDGLRPRRPTLPLWSTVTGGLCDEVSFDAEHWGRSLRDTVQFAAVTARLVASGCELFVEIGPEPTLTSAIRQELHAHQQSGSVLASLRRDRTPHQALLATLGELYCRGLDVEWSALCRGRADHVRLPSYPWQRQRYWFDQRQEQQQVEESTRADREADHRQAPAHSGAVWVTSPRWNQRAKLRLFCLPYGGRGASLFSAWADLLPPEVELCPVQLPGRENRIAEPSYTNMRELVEVLAVELKPFLDRPFALFGHCIGSQISYELARQLRDEGMPAPSQLFVSALNPPGHEKIAIIAEGCIHELPAEAFARAVRDNPETPAVMLEDERLFNLVLPPLRADFELYETHQHRPGPPLDCPITVFGAHDDVTVSVEHLEAWRAHTSGRYRRHMYPGDHFYLQQPRERDALLEQLGRELLELIGVKGS